MKFTLDAGGAQAAGQGIGGIFKALAMAPQVRQQAEQDAIKTGADIYYRQMAGQKFAADAQKNNAEADLSRQKLAFQQNPLENAMTELGLPTNLAPAFRERLATGSFGPSYEPPADGVGPTRPAPADNDTIAKLGRSIALLQRMNGTGSNVQQASAAELNQQTGRIRDQAVANVGNIDMMNRFNTLAKEGETYMPYGAIGDTGYSVNKATGQGEGLEVLRKLYGNESGAKVARDRGAANASNASAGKYSAEAEQTRTETGVLKTTGAKPGSGREASEGALSSTILNTLKVPALDEKGRPVRNPITGEQEMTVDLGAQKAFYQWADQNNRRPTAAAFTQWEAQGRPNKSPATAPDAPKIEPAPPAPQRKANAVYQTPKGPMKWTGTGWLPAN